MFGRPSCLFISMLFFCSRHRLISPNQVSHNQKALAGNLGCFVASGHLQNNWLRLRRRLGRSSRRYCRRDDQSKKRDWGKVLFHRTPESKSLGNKPVFPCRSTSLHSTSLDFAKEVYIQRYNFTNESATFHWSRPSFKSVNANQAFVLRTLCAVFPCIWHCTGGGVDAAMRTSLNKLSRAPCARGIFLFYIWKAASDAS